MEARPWFIVARRGSQQSAGQTYNCAPVGFTGVAGASFLRISLLRSLRASLPLRSRLKRALSPLIPDMVPKSNRFPQRTGRIVTVGARHSPALDPQVRGDKSLLTQMRTSCSSPSR